jgi:hypothetical protein
LLELLDEMVRQTDGLGLVPSGRAILNADSHSTPPFWQTPFASGPVVARRLRDAVHEDDYRGWRCGSRRWQRPGGNERDARRG